MRARSMRAPRFRARLGGASRSPGVEHEDSAVARARSGDCLSEEENATGRALGRGSYGAVYAILDERGRPTPWVLKISTINLRINLEDGPEGGALRVSERTPVGRRLRREEKEREETFLREVYYLD